MSLYQGSVLKKFLALQNSEEITKAYKKYSKYFLDKKIQNNIRNSKEEQFQEGFLREFFVNVLGYTLNPKPEFNLTTELKNVKGRKKVDGAILKDGAALAVIELKGTNTKDLEKVRQQAFDYKANQPSCIYVITSNFEKIRFYINDAVEFEEFNLFRLDVERFSLLYLCLARKNLLDNIPLKIKESSLLEEEKITQSFYADYSLFKRELYRDLVKLNMKNEIYRSEIDSADTIRANKNIKLSLFKNSQKLIDRFLFIFFAEDRGLLEPNSTLQVLREWENIKELDEDIPLYNRFKKYFNYLDQGRAGSENSAEVFAYNGGLFKPDPVLDSLIIDDGLLHKHTKALSRYDFDSQVDVNILGHIFENSLNEIESINAEIEGVVFEKQKTKRKKDGVFYTPRYITKYIIENTLGKLCSEKKISLKISESEYRPNRKKDTQRRLLGLLEEYREWLLKVTIIDPACGSGAFLNEALGWLIKEHGYVDELQTALFGGGFVFPNIENTILENNIFGVDINEESVEIAKLSLWLRTAQPRRKLNDLSNNIKCGNSLVDKASIAGEKAFNWSEEFSEIMRNGGFDIVVGNPPYGVIHEKQNLNYYKENFLSFQGNLENYCFFTEMFIGLTKSGNGKAGLIIPITWLTIPQFKNLRSLVLEYRIDSIVELPTKVFSDANLDTIICVIDNDKDQKNNTVDVVKIDSATSTNFEIGILNPRKIEQKEWVNGEDKRINLDFDKRHDKVLKKISRNSERLKTNFSVSQGIVPYARDELYNNMEKEAADKIVDERLWHSDHQKDEFFKPELKGEDVTRYRVKWNGIQWVRYGKWLARPRSPKYFNSSRILIREITRGHRLNAGYVEEESYNNPGLINVVYEGELKDDDVLKALLAVINSKFMFFYHLSTSPKAKLKTSIPKILIKDVENLPIPKQNDLVSSDLVDLCNQITDRTDEFIELEDRFVRYLVAKLTVAKLSKKLLSWSHLKPDEFLFELSKLVKKEKLQKLTNSDEMDWLELFENKRLKIVSISDKIGTLESQIDKIVYTLFLLTKDEIDFIENY